jgi:hypothetical protein
MHIRSEAAPPGTPPSLAAAALHMTRRPGLNLAMDEMLPPQPDDQPGPWGDPTAVAAGVTLTPVLRDPRR